MLGGMHEHADMDFQTLISAAELADHLPRVRLLDCRARLGDPAAGRRLYLEGHIPGALHADLDRDLAAQPGTRGRHPLPDIADFTASCRRWGLNDQDQVVVYDDMSGAMAARAWWMLRWLGHAHVAVLDGGLSAWQGELEQAESEFPGGAFTARAPISRLASVEQVMTADYDQLIDARSEERFAGDSEPIDHTAGHIPNAMCMPFNGNLDDDGRMLDTQRLTRRWADITADTICYCGSGVTAAHNVLAIVAAGQPEPRLYAGSWSEWIEDPARPIATGA